MIATGKPLDPITVVGAGPAGLACAIVLARAGKKVVVREVRSNVGARFHDDFQGLENWSAREDTLDELASAGLDVGFDFYPIHGGVAWDAKARRFEFSSKEPLFYLVRRGPQPGTLDRALLSQAEREGVEVRFGDRAQHADESAVLSGGPRWADVIAVGYVFRTSLSDGAWIVFDRRLAPGGYAYLLVHAGRGTLGSCMFSGFQQQHVYLTRTLKFFQQRLELTLQDASRFGGYGSFGLPSSALRDDYLVVGEQAGFQDALAGFGIRYALRSGILAARTLLQGRQNERSWASMILPQLRRGITNRFLINTFGDRAWSLILRGLALNGSDVRKGLQHLYQPSLLTDLIFPLALWRTRATSHDPNHRHDRRTQEALGTGEKKRAA